MVLLSIATHLVVGFGLQLDWENWPLYLAIVIGGYRLLADSLQSLRRGSFALDYIAILAIATGVWTENYLVASVVVLMMTGGNALENYAQAKAKNSLTALRNRLPNQVQLLDKTGHTKATAIEKVVLGSLILLRKGEVVPLDGTLESASGRFDEASLTGEAYPVEKQTGDLVRSGTVNLGEAVSIRTTSTNLDSTYSHIVKLVQEAETAKTPFIQLADRLSGSFTLLTIVLASLTYFFSGDMNRVLAVLVIATPCPLILATPIALIGGMNAAARERIIFKKLAALEKLARVKQLVFDKTGTITFGQPLLEKVEIKASGWTRQQVLATLGALEKNSLHPFAKAVMTVLGQEKIKPKSATEVKEQLGVGLVGLVDGQEFQVKGSRNATEAQISLYQDKSEIATLTFRDEIKPDSLRVIAKLQALGLKLAVFTGDKLATAQALVAKLPGEIELRASLSPQDKQQGIVDMRQQGDAVAMIGDGINDAPALASADVGLVFSHQEHSAASEAADVVLLSGNFGGVLRVILIAKHTMKIAKQSIYVGLGLSMGGMILAAFGFLTPLAGAIGQEAIDLLVIFNALRARKG